MSKTDIKTPLIPDTRKDVTNKPVNEFHFKVVGRGTSGWMAYASSDNGVTWYPLRQSETSFLSAATSIEPELNRLAFPHYSKARTK